MDPIIDKLKSLSGGEILDIATGSGDFLKVVASSFKDYTGAVGIDNSADHIKVAKENAQAGFRFQVMDAAKMEFEDNSFDTVTIRHSLHHMADLSATLSEVKRVLKPGGLFVICEIFNSPDITADNAQKHLHHWWAEVDMVFGRHHGPTYTEAEILDFLKPHDFKVIDKFDYLETFDDAETKEGLDSMLAHTRNYLKRIQDKGGHDDIATRGAALIERFERDGWVNDKYLYVLARK